MPIKREKTLFNPVRQCCVCACTARINAKPQDGVPTIVAITPVIYRKSRIKNAPKVQVCDTCLVRAIAERHPSPQSLRLWQSLMQSFSMRYSSMLEADVLDQVYCPTLDGGPSLV